MSKTKQTKQSKSCNIKGSYSLLATGLFLLFFYISPSSLAVKKCELKIFTRNSKIDLNEIKAFFNNANLFVARILQTEKRKKKSVNVYTIILMKDKDFKKINIVDKGKKGIRYYLPEEIGKWKNNDRIKAKIIASMILKHSKYRLDENYKKLPAWLIYAILSKVERRLDKANIPGIMTFPGMHMLLTTSPPPELLEIASRPVHSEDGPLYNIFLETSEIMLDSIWRLPKRKESLKDLISLSMKGFPTKEAFIQAYAKKVFVYKNNTTEALDDQELKSPDVLKQWLLDNAILMSINTFKPGNAHFAEEQFRKIEMLKYIAIPDQTSKDKKEERFCQVSELQSKQKEIENFSAVIRSKELDFARLAFSTPSILQPGILKIRESLEMLRMGTIRNFESSYKQAKQEFYNGIDRMNKLETYLAKTERDSLPASWKYRYELEEMKKWDKKRKKRWPSLTKYMDKLEKEY